MKKFSQQNLGGFIVALGVVVGILGNVQIAAILIALGVGAHSFPTVLKGFRTRPIDAVVPLLVIVVLITIALALPKGK